MAMTLVSTVTVGAGGAASIQFTSIPQTGKDLLLLTSLRLNSTLYSVLLRFNGLSSGYAYRTLTGNGSAATSENNEFGTSGIGVVRNLSDTTSNTFSNNAIYISNYASSSAKTISIDDVSENNATAALQKLTAASSNAPAISSLALDSSGIVQHSTASLYIIS